MKLIIFAGGAGTRLWPLSRKALPKQFIKMFDGKSTLQMAVERVQKPFGLENIVISTNEQYVAMVKADLPKLPAANIVAEPEKRDLAPAVGLNLMRLKKQGYTGPVALLWADHLMQHVAEFVRVLQAAEAYCRKYPDKLVFIAEQPRFANNNLGWIKVGAQQPEGTFDFLGWRYKPESEECMQMFLSGQWLWNPGYLVEDLANALALYQKYQPELYAGLQEIYQALGTQAELSTLAKIYPSLPKLSHDAAIAEKLPKDSAVVFVTDMRWSDPGTLYALKEALVPDETANLEYGLTSLTDSKDTMLYNLEPGKLLAGIGLAGMVVVNTKDAVLVVPKDQVVKISKLVDALALDPKLKEFV
jgi:mannose-1-phosphate guanylyltransferase